MKKRGRGMGINLFFFFPFICIGVSDPEDEWEMLLRRVWEGKEREVDHFSVLVFLGLVSRERHTLRAYYSAGVPFLFRIRWHRRISSL